MSTPNVASNIKGLQEPKKNRLKNHGVSLLFFTLSLACFGLFARNAFLARTLSGTSSIIGWLMNGEASRKRHGDKEFFPVALNSPLHNLDSIWVGKDQQAMVKLEDGTSLEVKEKTLVLFKRPFASNSALSDKVLVLKGSVKVSGTGVILTDRENSEKMKEVPKQGKKDEQKSPERQKLEEEKVFPKQDSIIYFVQKQANEASVSFKTTFTWPDRVSGHLVLQDSTSNRVRYFPLTQNNFADVDISLERSYVWQVVDQEKKVIAGPFSFEVHRVLKKEMNSVLDHGLKQAGQRPVQIRFEE